MARPRTTENEAGKIAAETDYAQLRELLFGDGLRKLREHRERLQRLEDNALEDTYSLARALALESKNDPRIRKALIPVVEDELRASVEENPSTLAGILFPMIGEAVRKAVAASTQQMMDSTNDLLADSLSAERIGWRFEAWKSGKTFAEIALAHTLSYRVEHVYVIHRNSGLLLGQVTNRANLLEDADMVVGMLTAIQDFVRDSFSAKEQHDLDVIQVGEFKIWLQHGPSALLAAVISGQPKQHVREVLVKQVEQIHRNHQTGIARFEQTGEAVPGIGAGLEECLLEEVQQKAKKQQAYLKFKVAGGILLAVLAAIAVFYLHRAWEWNRYLDRLRQQPGLVVISDTRGWTTLTVQGLRDPMAVAPEALLAGYDLRASEVSEVWEPYYSLDPRFVAMRQLEDAAATLRRATIHFPVDSTSLSVDQLALLDSIGTEAVQLAVEANRQGRYLRIQVQGHTDQSGSSEYNALLSQDRANGVANYLIARGVPAGLLSATGTSDTSAGFTGGAGSGQDLDRRVTIAVDLR